MSAVSPVDRKPGTEDIQIEPEAQLRQEVQVWEDLPQGPRTRIV